LLEVKPERLSIKYLGTSNNLKNRLTESGGRAPELTVALTEPKDVQNVARNAKNLMGAGRPLKAVAIATDDNGKGWSVVTILHDPSTEIGMRVQKLFPNATSELENT
jgi:predicted transcriptional regulator